MLTNAKRADALSYFDRLVRLVEIREEAAGHDERRLADDPIYCGMIASLATCDALAAVEAAGQECHEEMIDTAEEATGTVAEALEGLTEALQGLIPSARSPRVSRARA